jgi:hypothetical protein
LLKEKKQRNKQKNNPEMYKEKLKKMWQLKKKPKASVFYCGLHCAVHNKTLIPFSIYYN